MSCESNGPENSGPASEPGSGLSSTPDSPSSSGQSSLERAASLQRLARPGSLANGSNYPSQALAGEAEAAEESRPEKVLLFRVAYLRLAIPLDRIRIVQRSEGIEPLPESPRHVVGLMELGPAESVPVVDLAHSLAIRNTAEGGIESSRRAPSYLEPLGGGKEHVLIYNSDRGTVGFLIDRAEAVVEAVVHPLPAALADAASSLTGLARIEEDTAYLIDLERHVPQG